VLWLAHGDLKATLLVLCLLSGAASCLFIETCRRAFGEVTAVGAGTLIFVFYGRFVDTPGTEQLGLILGLIATALLLEAASSHHRGAAWWGLFLLGMALIARAGAFFVLPAVALWIALSLRRARGGMLWLQLARGSCTIALAFALNALLFRSVGSSDQPPFGNFAFTLYGLVTGGHGWIAAYTLHPDLAQLPFNVRCREVYALAWQEFTRRPGLTLVGAARYLAEFFAPTASGMFGFVVAQRFTEGELPTLLRVFDVAARLALLSMFVWGARCALAFKRNPRCSLLLYAAAGLLASVPFVPPADSDQTRAYAATIPLIVLVASFGLEDVTRRVRGAALALPSSLDRPRWALPASLGVSLVVAAVAGPVLVLSRATRQTAAATACPVGQASRHVWLAHAPRVAWTAESSDGSLFDVLDVVRGTRVLLVLPAPLAASAETGQLTEVCGVTARQRALDVFVGRSLSPAKIGGARE
jgi:hypothetical protein